MEKCMSIKMEKARTACLQRKILSFLQKGDSYCFSSTNHASVLIVILNHLYVFASIVGRILHFQMCFCHKCCMYTDLSRNVSFWECLCVICNLRWSPLSLQFWRHWHWNKLYWSMVEMIFGGMYRLLILFEGLLRFVVWHLIPVDKLNWGTRVFWVGWWQLSVLKFEIVL